MVRVLSILILCFFSQFLLGQKASAPYFKTTSKDSVNKYEISKDSLISIIKAINTVLSKKDTTLLNDTICVEILRGKNTFWYYGESNLNLDFTDYDILTIFYGLINRRSRFGSMLDEYMLNNGEPRITPGMGMYFAKYDVYFGGRIMNNSSYYIIK